MKITKRVIVAATLATVTVASSAAALDHHQGQQSREQMKNIGQAMPPAKPAHGVQQRKPNVQPIQAPWSRHRQEVSKRTRKPQLRRVKNMGQLMPPQLSVQRSTEERPRGLLIQEREIGQPLPPQQRTRRGGK